MPKSRKKYWVCVVLTCLVSVSALGGFAWLVLLPQRRHIDELENTVLTKQEAFEGLRLASSENWREATESQLTAMRGTLDDFVADFSDSSHFSFVVSEIARQEQVGSLSSRPLLLGRSVASTEDKGLLEEQRLRLTFGCGFEQFVRTLNALERHKPIVFVDQFIVEADKNEEGKLKVEMEVAVIVKRSVQKQDEG